MTFNARWQLEDLAREVGNEIPDLLDEFKRDFERMVRTCPTFRLEAANSGNYFILSDRNGEKCEPPDIPGLYVIFTERAVVYCGEAESLFRRQLKDPDNTANSGETFNNQGRAIIKLLLHRGWAERLDLAPMFMQIYPGDVKLEEQDHRTFEQAYKVSTYSKALEGVAALIMHELHGGIVHRAKEDGVLPG